MKIKVIKSFLDKFDNSVRYQPGTVLDIEDEERVKDIIARGFGELLTKVNSKKNKQ